VSTLAGTPDAIGGDDGAGAAARFRYPSAEAVNAAGTVYVADSGGCTIRAVTPDGGVTTLAGTYATCGSADGTGAGARFGSPLGLALDDAGNLYVADAVNHEIRKVTPAGVVTTVLGAPHQAGIRLGLDGRLWRPTAVAMVAPGLLAIVSSNAVLLAAVP